MANVLMIAGLAMLDVIPVGCRMILARASNAGKGGTYSGAFLNGWMSGLARRPARRQ